MSAARSSLAALLTATRLAAEPVPSVESAVVQGAPAARREAGLPFIRTFGAKDYEGAVQNWALVQDPRGVVYVANNDGVLEFDGLRWRTIRTPGRTLIRSLAVDTAGRVLVGGVGEIGILAPDTIGALRFVSLLERLPPAERSFADVLQVFAVPDGVVFVTARRLFRVRESRVESWAPETSFQAAFVVGSRVFARQLDRGLFELANGRLELLPGGERFASDRVCAVLPVPGSPNAVLVVSRNQGLVLFDGGAFHALPTEADEALKRDLVYAATRLSGGRLAVGTVQGGLYLLDAEGRWIGRLDKARGLPDDTVYGLLVDRDGGLWLALNRGLARVEVSSPLTRFDERAGLPGTVHALHGHQGRLYAGTNLGLFRLDEGPEPRFRPVSGIKDQTWAMLSAGESLIVANNQGAYEIRGEEATLIRRDQVLALPEVPAEPDVVHVGVREGVALLRRVDGRWTDGGRLPGISDPVRKLLTRPGGKLWAGSRNNGALLVTWAPKGPPAVRRFGIADGLPTLNHNYPYPVGAEVLFATHAGVYRFDERRARFEPDPRFAGLFPSGRRWVYALARDPVGRVWMHAMDESSGAIETGAGVPQPDGNYRWDGRALAPIAGIGVGAIHAGNDGAVWLGGDEGLFRYDPGVEEVQRPKTSVLVRRVGRPGGGESVRFGGAGRPAVPVIPYAENAVRFEYAAPVFDGPPVRFQVFLEGNDDGWSSFTTDGYREYTNLREGSYRFRVRAMGLHGEASEEAVYELRVRPPWFRTVWAFLGYALLAVGLAWALVRWRLRRVQAEKEALAAIVAARTTELTAKTAELQEANRKLGRAQEQFEEMLSSAPQASEGVVEWARRLASDIGGAVGAKDIGVWELSRDSLVPIADAGIPAPSGEEIERLRSVNAPAFVESGGGVLLPVRGLSGELRGALVVNGSSPDWDDVERRVLNGFAHQLGAALDLRLLRHQLDRAQERRTASRREMHEQGIATLQLCPSCGRCYDHTATVCLEDGTALESPRALPYRLLGRYRLTRVLGQGAMGLVLTARDERLNRDVAVKLVRPEHFNDTALRHRFEREARAIARIQHPGVVALHDFGELDDGTAFLVMERLQGSDLRTVLLSHGRGSPSQVARLTRQGAAALRAAHLAGIVHRDLKPENVFLVDEAEGFRVKIVDFGLAKSLNRERSLTRTGMIVGTPAYMAPEQVRGEDLDARVDVYAFAAVVFEALTGRPVVLGADIAQIFVNVLNAVPPAVSSFLPGVPPAVDAAFASALAKDPARRPKDVELWAESFADVLERVPPGGANGWPTAPEALGSLGARRGGPSTEWTGGAATRSSGSD